MCNTIQIRLYPTVCNRCGIGYPDKEEHPKNPLCPTCQIYFPNSKSKLAKLQKGEF